LYNRQNRKPVSVLTCHLSARSTPRKRAGSPSVPQDVPVYMIFLVLVPPPPHVAIRRREPLPRGFTLTLVGRSVFCCGIHKITPICAFHSRMPFPVRTFLCLKFLMVISLSLLVAHILTTRRLLRYSRLAFLEIPHHKFQTATSRSTYLYPSLRSVLSFCAMIFSTAFSSPGVMSSHLLWHCIDFEYILPMQKLLCSQPLQ